MATIDDVKASYLAINRVELNDATATAVASQIDGGTLTLAAYQTNLIGQSVNTTQAAFALSSFIQGVVPSSAQVDALTAFAVTQNTYYTDVLESPNAQLGAYEALGKAFAADATTSAAFSAKYGAFSAAEFVNTAYAEIFNGAVPSAAAAANLIAQVNYFTTIYTAAGIPAADAALQAKGAVLGQIIGYAFTADADDLPAGGSPLTAAVAATMQLAADEGVAGTAEADSEVYGQPISGAGATIAIAVDESATLDIATIIGQNKATTFGDTVTGNIENATVDVTLNTAAGNDKIGTATAKVTIEENVANALTIDGSGGADVLYAVVDGTGISDAVKILNVEKLYFEASAAATINTKSFAGVTELWSHQTATDVTFDAVASGITLGVEANVAGANTFFNLAEEGSASLSLKGASAADINVTNATSLTVNALTNSTSALLAGDAKTLAFTGDANVNITDVALDAEWTSIDASGSKGSVALAGVEASDAVSTIKLSEKADSLGLTLAGTSEAVTITTGAGADAIAISGGGNVGDIDTTKSVATTIADFTTKSDTLDVAVAGAEYVLTAGDKTTISGLSLAGALDHIASVMGAATGDGAEFTFASDSYVYVDFDMDNAFSAGDTLIKLAGITTVDAADITFS